MQGQLFMFVGADQKTIEDLTCIPPGDVFPSGLLPWQIKDSLLQAILRYHKADEASYEGRIVALSVGPEARL